MQIVDGFAGELAVSRETLHIVIDIAVASGGLDEFGQAVPEAQAHAQVRIIEIYNSTGTGGDWHDSSTWSGGTFPGPNDGVSITAGTTVTVRSGDGVCQKLSIAPGGVLVVDAGFNLEANIVNNGGTLIIKQINNSPSAFHILDQQGGVAYYGLELTPTIRASLPISAYSRRKLGRSSRPIESSLVS